MNPFDGQQNSWRRRGDSFGGAAADYDRHRPRYPASLICGLLHGTGEHVLDVGAGTGIASTQLRDAGAEVLGVEPDPRMAHVALTHGITVEQSRFEEWDPAGRTFDLVVFAQSFHWMRQQPALDTVATILRPGGRLVLLSNRITPVNPTGEELDAAYAGLLDPAAHPSTDAAREQDLLTGIRNRGYTIDRRDATEHQQYSTDEWVSLVSTYSSALTLPREARTELRARLQRIIGGRGVLARNDAIALLCARA